MYHTNRVQIFVLHWFSGVLSKKKNHVDGVIYVEMCWNWTFRKTVVSSWVFFISNCVIVFSNFFPILSKMLLRKTQKRPSGEGVAANAQTRQIPHPRQQNGSYIFHFPDVHCSHASFSQYAVNEHSYNSLLKSPSTVRLEIKFIIVPFNNCHWNFIFFFFVTEEESGLKNLKK